MSQENVELVRDTMELLNRSSRGERGLGLLKRFAPDFRIDTSRRVFNPDVYVGGASMDHRGACGTIRSMAPDGEAQLAAARHAVDATAEEPLGESRWPPIAAVLVFMVINIAVRIWLPREATFHLPWLVPSIEAGLIIGLLTSDPTGPAERQRLRHMSLVLVGLLVVAALWATVVLVNDLIKGVGVSNSPSELLAAGAVVWLGNNLSFALLYWLIDSGGPRARTQMSVPVDFAFTQQMSPELAPPGWRPVFLDYLHLGFTNATAFSPTDVMPLSLRAKYTMLVQSTVALALFGLVVARAVNAFT